MSLSYSCDIDSGDELVLQIAELCLHIFSELVEVCLDLSLPVLDRVLQESNNKGHHTQIRNNSFKNSE